MTLRNDKLNDEGTNGGDSLEGKLRVTARSCLLPVHPKFVQQKSSHQLCFSLAWLMGKLSAVRLFATVDDLGGFL
jgi:hypothetical protein